GHALAHEGTRPEPAVQASLRHSATTLRHERGPCGPGAAAPGSVPSMRCSACGHLDSKVVDSRQSDDGSAIRRRRECLVCGFRFTTFERSEAQGLTVLKRSGDREQFDRSKVAAGVHAAPKGRPGGPGGAGALAVAVEAEVRSLPSGEVTTERIGRAVLEHLRELDVIAA